MKEIKENKRKRERAKERWWGVCMLVSELVKMGEESFNQWQTGFKIFTGKTFKSPT